MVDYGLVMKFLKLLGWHYIFNALMQGLMTADIHSKNYREILLGLNKTQLGNLACGMFQIF